MLQFSFLFLLWLAAHLSEQTANKALESYTTTYRRDVLYGDAINTVLKDHNQFSCAMMCSRRASCKMAIVDEKNKACMLTRNVVADNLGFSLVQDEVPHGRYLYIQMLGTLNPLDEIRNKVYKSCQDLKTKHPNAPSGIYWIDPLSQGDLLKKLQLYCNQDLDGGGWTLVWTYRFTHYNNFKNVMNRITPLPAWSNVDYCDSPVSNTPPKSEYNLGAVPYRLWKKLGKKFLIKSNIMNWISCTPGVGSLVKEYSGSVHCTVVRQLTPSCGDVPRWIGYRPRHCGVILRLRPPKPGNGAILCAGKYIVLKGSSQSGWPIHDACGACSASHLKGVAKPRVNVYIRA